MRRACAVGACVVLALAAGCASRKPQSAEEMRQAVAFAEVKSESFEVKRRHRDVADSLRRRADQCFNVKVRGVAYKPTIVVSSRKAELHLQRHQDADPGYYVLVADAWPVRRERTRVQLFAPAAGYDALIRAVKAWANGATAACPDMSKTG